MPSDISLEIRLMHLEDQMNRMNLVLTEHGRKLDELSEGISVLMKRLNSLDEGNREHGISEVPPDGANR